MCSISTDISLSAFRAYSSIRLGPAALQYEFNEPIAVAISLLVVSSISISRSFLAGGISGWFSNEDVFKSSVKCSELLSLIKA